MIRTFTACAAAMLFVSSASAEVFTYTASKDSFLREGAPNTNEGANKKLNIRKVGKRRALVAFDLSTLAVPAGTEVVSADVRVFVTKNNKLWTKKGRQVGIHRMVSDWTEGNGSNAKVPSTDLETGSESDVTKNRGTGAGTTWKCPTDTNIGNRKKDCSTQWKGGNFASTASSTVTVTNSTSGNLDFDVTDDVKQFVANTATNYGWMIKKSDQKRVGGIWIYSKESTTNQPQLIVQTGYAFDLSGAEEIPTVTTTATGSCTTALSNDETSLSVECTHTATGATMAHIHDGIAGAEGAVVCDLGNGRSPISTTCTMTADLVTKYKNAGLYVNVHTNSNPGGELRGQIQ